MYKCLSNTQTHTQTQTHTHTQYGIWIDEIMYKCSCTHTHTHTHSLRDTWIDEPEILILCDKYTCHFCQLPKEIEDEDCGNLIMIGLLIKLVIPSVNSALTLSLH